MAEKRVFKTNHPELIKSMKPEFNLVTEVARSLSTEVPVGSEAEAHADNKILHSLVHQVLAIKLGIQIGREKADVLNICDDVIERMETQIAEAGDSLTLDFTNFVDGLRSMKSKIEEYDFSTSTQAPSNT